MQAREAPGVATVGLHPVTGCLRDERGGDDVGAHADGGEQARKVVARRPGFVAGEEIARVSEAGDQPADRRFVVGDLLGVGLDLIGTKDRHGDRVLSYVEPKMNASSLGSLLCWHGRLLSVCGSVHAESVDDPRLSR